MSCNRLATMGTNTFLKLIVHMANEANFLFPDCSLFTMKNQIIFKTCLCKSSISHHSSLCCIFFPLVHPFASSVPQEVPSKNTHEKWQNCIFCLTSVKPDPDFIFSSWFLALQKQGALEGTLGHWSCQSAAHPTERTVLSRMTQPNGKNWTCTNSKGGI